MKKSYEYIPRGVCAVKMTVEEENGIITNVEIIGGCPGNSLGVSKLCIGMKVEEAIKVLDGIDCRGRGTSCPDQLSKALIKTSYPARWYSASFNWPFCSNFNV